MRAAPALASASPRLARPARADREAHRADHAADECVDPGLAAAGEMAVEQKMGEAVHQRPGRRGGEGRVGAVLRELFLEAGMRGARLLAQLRVTLVRDAPAEHEAEALRMLEREAHVRGGALLPAAQVERLAQPGKSFRGERGEERLAVG